jgi:hypothetical protein
VIVRVVTRVQGKIVVEEVLIINISAATGENPEIIEKVAARKGGLTENNNNNK